MNTFLERQQVRRRRAWKKSFRHMEKWLMGGGIFMGGLLVLYGFFSLLFLTSYLSVQQIIVDGEGSRINRELIIRLSEVERGENLFRIDVEGVHARLRSNPWIKSSVVRRRLPHTLWIYVEEYIPVGIVEANDSFYYADNEGNIFKELEPLDDKSFPILTGIVEEVAGGTHSHERLQHALHLLQWSERSNLTEENGVAEVHYDELRGYSVVTYPEPIQIFLGHDHLEAQMEKLSRYSPSIRKRGGNIRYILVQDEDRIVVKYVTI